MLEGIGGQRNVPPLYLREREKLPILKEGGCAPGQVWTGAENLVPIGIRSPDRQSRSESLYRLSYPGSVYISRSTVVSLIADLLGYDSVNFGRF
jgi:hypothetical protein